MNKKEKKQLILDFINGPLKEYLHEEKISFGKFKERINEICGTDFTYSDLYPSYLFNAQLAYEEADFLNRSDLEKRRIYCQEKEKKMTEQEQQKNQENSVITVFEFAIIHNALAETYNAFKKRLEEKNYGDLTEDQINYACFHLFETFKKVDALLEPHKEFLKQPNPRLEEQDATDG